VFTNMQKYEKKSKIKNQKSKIDFLLHAGFVITIALAAWFHGLRSTFGESAMILFNLISEPNLLASSTWFSAHWLQNIMTILAIKSNLSLSLVSLVFSASPMIFLYSVFLITHYGFKQKNAGIFLLLLLLGINQTFFIAVHTPLILVATIYLIIECLRAIWKKYNIEFLPYHEMSYWGIACGFLLLNFIPVSPNIYGDVISGEHYFSSINYFLSVAIGTFVISFLMAACLALYWIWKKQIEVFILFGCWMTIMMIVLLFLKQKYLLDVHYELLYFPVVAGIIAFFVITFGKDIQQTPSSNSESKPYKFWILSALLIFAVFGQLRTLSEFQERQTFVVKLIEHAPEVGEKHALPERLQQLERYIDPTYLAFETPLISGLRGLPTKSILFVPEDTTRNRSFLKAQATPRISANITNISYFYFSDQDYNLSSQPFIKRSLFEVLRYGEDTVFACKERVLLFQDNGTQPAFHTIPTQALPRPPVVYTGPLAQFATVIRVYLERGDSISASVWRKGSNYGHLVLSDVKTKTDFWLNGQVVLGPTTLGWQKLSLTEIIQSKERFAIYVWNENYKKETIFFDEFRVEIWRE